MKLISSLLLSSLLLNGLSVGAATLPTLVRIEGFLQAAPGQPPERVSPVNRCQGFIVEKEGFLLTNYKNLTDPTSGRLLDDFQVRVGLADKAYEANVIGVEPTLNIGILKIESEESFTPSLTAREKPVIVGSKLAAVSGIKDSVWQTVEGTVAALNTRQCYQESLTSTMFRAKINLTQESLGGPVFDPGTGTVIALYTGFKPVPEPGHQEVPDETHLMPITLCFNIYDSIKQKGSLKSPWTGFSVRALNQAEMGFFPTAKKHQGGVAIEHVWDNSPAQRLGIQVNDILVQFSYNRILTVADFQKWLYMYGVGHPVKLMIVRNGTEYLVTDYTIEERPLWARPK